MGGFLTIRGLGVQGPHAGWHSWLAQSNAPAPDLSTTAAEMHVRLAGSTCCQCLFAACTLPVLVATRHPQALQLPVPRTPIVFEWLLLPMPASVPNRLPVPPVHINRRKPPNTAAAPTTRTIAALPTELLNPCRSLQGAVSSFKQQWQKGRVAWLLQRARFRQELSQAGGSCWHHISSELAGHLRHLNPCMLPTTRECNVSQDAHRLGR